jgi:hypothetical protein
MEKLTKDQNKDLISFEYYKSYFIRNNFKQVNKIDIKKQTHKESV